MVYYPKVGDYLARDGNTFTGIMIITDITNHYATSLIFNNFHRQRLKKEDDYIYEEGGRLLDHNSISDRLLTLRDIKRLVNKMSLKDICQEEKEFIRNAVLWCLQRESLTQEEKCDI
jgi:hypothetical protein